MKPIPKQIGYVQCTIERNTSGVNKFFPKYTLKLSDGNKTMLIGDKISNSATSHYKINIDSSIPKADTYLGRLRGNFGSTQMYIYGKGLNPKEANKLGIDFKAQIRNQYGTIFYNEKDNFGKKIPRHMEVYIPHISEDMNEVTFWEDKADKKKENINFEYK